MKEHCSVLRLSFIFHCLRSVLANNDYYGTYVGDFQNRFHGVSGEVYAVDSRTLFIKDFRYVLIMFIKKQGWLIFRFPKKDAVNITFNLKSATNVV